MSQEYIDWDRAVNYSEQAGSIEQGITKYLKGMGLEFLTEPTRK
jgi:hypothetical protein